MPTRLSGYEIVIIFQLLFSLLLVSYVLRLRDELRMLTRWIDGQLNAEIPATIGLAKPCRALSAHGAGWQTGARGRPPARSLNLRRQLGAIIVAAKGQAGAAPAGAGR